MEQEVICFPGSPCRSILAPLSFNSVDTNIGKVFYHFSTSKTKFQDADKYCKDMKFEVNLPEPEEDFEMFSLPHVKFVKTMRYFGILKDRGGSKYHLANRVPSYRSIRS